MPIFHRAADVGILRALAASSQQQHQPFTGQRVVDAQARPRIDTQFPHALAAEPVIAEIPRCQTRYTADDRHLVAQAAQAAQAA